MSKEKTLGDLAKEFPNKSYKELEIYREKDREEEAGICVMGEMRKDREDLDWHEKYNMEHKLRQEAEGELTIVKGIGNSSPEMKSLKSEVEALKQQLHVDREKYRKDNNDLYNRIADSLELNESHQKTNGKLQERLTELEEENKKLHDHLTKQVENARNSGL